MATMVGSAPPITPAVTPAGRQLTRREARAFTVFSLWAVTGLFVDGWAHNHHKPETFFTPWHAVLYSGVGFAILWFVRESRRTATDVSTIDIVAGAMMIGGGALDMVWHIVFGIEIGVGALLSPTHLLLMTGGLLFVSGPIRSAWRDGTSRLDWTASLSLALSVGLLSFFTMFLSAFRTTTPGFRDGSGGISEMFAVLGVASVLWSTILIVAPVLAVTRRWRVSLRALVVITGLPALGMVGLDGFGHIALVIPVVIGALLASRVAPKYAAVAMITAVWPLYFAVYALAFGMRWSAEAWSGACVMALVTTAGLTALAWAPTPDVMAVRSGGEGA